MLSRLKKEQSENELMLVKQCHKPPRLMVYTTPFLFQKNVKYGGGGSYCFTHIYFLGGYLKLATWPASIIPRWTVKVSPRSYKLVAENPLSNLYNIYILYIYYIYNIIYISRKSKMIVCVGINTNFAIVRPPSCAGPRPQFRTGVAPWLNRGPFWGWWAITLLVKICCRLWQVIAFFLFAIRDVNFTHI